jgi:hypothetical protein
MDQLQQFGSTSQSVSIRQPIPRPSFSWEVVAPHPDSFSSLPEMLFETLEHYVHLIFAAFMLSRFTHVCLYLFIIEERVLMHPTVHVGLGSSVSTSPLFHQLLALVTCLPPEDSA